MKIFLGIGLGPIQTGIFVSGASKGGFDRIVVAEVDENVKNPVNRGGGKITVRMRRQNRIMTFTVKDTGKGMTPEQLREVEAMLKEESPTVQAAMEPGHSGFGLRNVDMRLRLYYRKKTGLLLQSGPEGTEVSFSIPIRTREEIDHDESLSRG